MPGGFLVLDYLACETPQDMSSMLHRIVQEHMKTAATKGTVGVFLILLTSKITQADKAAQERSYKRPGGHFNIHALPLMLEAAQKVEDRMRAYKDRDDPEALERLKAEIKRSFNDVSPIRATIKQIDAFLATGKLPSLVRK